MTDENVRVKGEAVNEQTLEERARNVSRYRRYVNGKLVEDWSDTNLARQIAEFAREEIQRQREADKARIAELEKTLSGLFEDAARAALKGTKP